MEEDAGVLMRARYPGTCATCGEKFAVADMILWNKQKKKGIHRKCVPLETVKKAPRHEVRKYDPYIPKLEPTRFELPPPRKKKKSVGG